MTTILFVHGASVREPRYSEEFKYIKNTLLSRRSDLTVKCCYWGEPYGAQLHKQGKSIPEYDSTRSIDTLTDDNYEIVLWNLLYQDPLYELRLLSLRSGEVVELPPGQKTPGEALNEAVITFKASPELKVKLEKAGLAALFDVARQTVYRAAPYRDALFGAAEVSGAHRSAIARAIVAQTIALANEQGSFAPIQTDADLRDEIVDHLTEALGGTDRAIGDWMLRHLGGIASRLVTFGAKRRRGAITDAAHPFVGDVVLYQGRGEQIRVFIRQRIVELEAPVVLLTHSLGGVACVDLLSMEDLPAVKLLITVGSQAPLLYEINALRSLRHTDTLPEYFPQWLNIYDLRDFLSYVGSEVFPGKVEDAQVDNKQPFPQSHSAYWTNPDVWATIIERLP